jgi:membrane-associated phospholipid phosphatase
VSVHDHTAGAIRGEQPVAPAARSRAAAALYVAGLCLLALALTWVVAELVPAAQVRDAVALHRFTLLDGPRVDAIAEFLLHLLDPPLFTIWGVALVLFAAARRRPRVGLAVALVLGLAPLSADGLKPLLAHPHVRIGETHISSASWPSGHATAALALALCAVLVAPTRLRPAVGALGAAFSAAVGCALLIRSWHLPSDVLGGYLLAGLWTAVAVAALRAADRRWPFDRSPRRSLRENSPARSAQQVYGAESEPWAPGSHKDSVPSPSPVSVFTARLRMNRRSESRFR